MIEKISLPTIPEDVSAEIEYIVSTLNRIEAGEPVWMQRNFHSISEIILDYYSDRIHRGYVTQSNLDFGCKAYMFSKDDQRGTPICLTSEVVSFDQAVIILLTALLPDTAN